ncbi:hypothetical protein [Pareuzebyella sediminis]|uniref:hypothetical protein n=1 Tax=Pareuzebyella sediminis TaxID=2607998 RepID=UPI0011ECF684|nr:hypothetical protein [Pareuzebyella sediminis]
MKTSNALRIVLGILVVVTSIGCGSEDVGGGVTFIPTFNATWPVEGDEDRQISLQPNEDNKGVEKGIFEGAEILQTDSGEVQNPLAGSFNGLNIEFTITRENNAKVKYTGLMVPVSETDHQIVRIELHSSEGNLALAF